MHRIVLLASCLSLAACPRPAAGPAQPGAGGGATCQAAARKLLGVEAGGQPRPGGERVEAEVAATCADQGWSTPLLACFDRAADKDQVVACAQQYLTEAQMAEVDQRVKAVEAELQQAPPY